ncbi:pyruvate formate lyase family protein [Dubosiella newyorkensis]|uniref:pyruvate formate lyase family protein n=1 Tax=Dubosiella newyorkensis TaxID=1862672 RepID=UPI003F66D44C
MERPCPLVDLDIPRYYFERDLKEGTLTEQEAQEIIDIMTMKFRMVNSLVFLATISSFRRSSWATSMCRTRNGCLLWSRKHASVLAYARKYGPSPEPNLTCSIHRAARAFQAVRPRFRSIQARFNMKR